MATIRRPVNSVPIPNSINEQYFNFTEYKGICDKENFIDIDPQTFADGNNIYVDQAGQLSSRPPVILHNVLLANETIVKIFKVNDITFYHLSFPSGGFTYYRLRFVYNGTTYNNLVDRDINIMWYDDKYLIFSQTTAGVFSLKAFRFNYTSDGPEYEPLTAAQITYVPITKIVTEGVVSDNEQPNLLSNTEIARYIFEYSKTQNTANLIGKAIKVHIGEEEFDITFVHGNEYVFTKAVGSIVADILQVSNKQTFLAYTIGSNNAYYSVDGNVWRTVRMPYTERPFFCDDGLGIYQLSVTSTQRRLAHVPIDKIGATTFNWTTNNYVNYPSAVRVNHGDTGEYWNTSLENVVTKPEYIYDGHSPEYGVFAFVIGVTARTRTWRNTSPTYSETGTLEWTETADSVAFYVYKNSDTTVSMNIQYSSAVSATDLRCRLAISAETSTLTYSYNFTASLPAGPAFGLRTIVLNSNMVPYNIISTLGPSGSWCMDYADIANFIYNTSHIGYTAKMTAQNAVIIKAAYDTVDKDYLNTYVINCNLVSTYNPAEYVGSYNFNGAFPVNRLNPIFQTINNNVGTQLLNDSPSTKFAVSDDTILTDKYAYKEGSAIQLLDRLITNTPLYTTNNTIIYYGSNNNIYTNNILDKVYVDLATTTAGSITNLFPSNVGNFISNVIAKDNKVYWSTPTSPKGMVYFTEENSVSFPSEVTALINFSNTSMGIFLENEVHELQYFADGDFYKSPKTKLQLGNKKGSEVLLSYDGKTIFVTTLKGLSALDYQDFVQSTDQVYSYLTENIMNSYDKYYGPICLYQHKDWIYMYKKTSKELFLYDLRNLSWWRLTFPYNLEQVIYDGTQLLFIMNKQLYKYDYNFDKYFDAAVTKINWHFTSQKLHFSAPNNYKHIRSLSIVTSPKLKQSVRYKLKFKNYRNLNNTSETDTVEYNVDELATMIKRVNFIKTNAFQFTVANDLTDKLPNKFETANIAIKHRITERLR